MSTHNVILTEQQETVITRLVRSGRYRNASEVVGEGLRLVESKEAASNGGATAISSDLEQLILEVRAAREAAVPLRPGEILAWRDEGRRHD